VSAAPIVNALVPFSTRLGDDGLVHVRAWSTPAGPVAIVAELDWAVLVADPADAYYGPGIYTYPDYALGAAAEPLEAAGLSGARVIVRMPDPPGERMVLVTDPDDPGAWPDIGQAELARMLPGADTEGPPPGAYIRRVVEAWVRDGALPG